MRCVDALLSIMHCVALRSGNKVLSMRCVALCDDPLIMRCVALRDDTSMMRCVALRDVPLIMRCVTESVLSRWNHYVECSLDGPINQEKQP